jgi:hypothetical protein
MNARDRSGISAIDWARVAEDLDARGNAVIEGLITAAECDALAALYPRDERFRSRVAMARHGFGRGEYKYFGYPLPPLFLFGGLKRSDRVARVPLEHGDVVVWGGPARMRYHGVSPVKAGPLLGAHRINLTFRRAG